MCIDSGTGQKPPDKSHPRTNSPHNEIIIESYHIFFYTDVDI
jgi:hypothetical protein